MSLIVQPTSVHRCACHLPKAQSRSELEKFSRKQRCLDLNVRVPFDRRNIQELSNAVNKFGKFLTWDRVRCTRANLMVKVRVEKLSDIPTSIVFGEGDTFQSGSLTVPIVILQHQILGVVPPDEDPVQPQDNPHPIPPQVVYHPNQHNHFGPYSAT